MKVTMVLLAALTFTPASAQTLQRMRPPTGGTALAVYREAQSYTRPCAAPDAEAQRMCEFNQESFLRDYLRARAGDYQGQRNVAYALSDPGGPANREENAGVAPNLLQACAWRIVIMTAGHAEVGLGDDANARTACGKLGASGVPAATARAQELHRLIATDPVRGAPPRSMPMTTERRPQRRASQPLDGTARPLTAN